MKKTISFSNVTHRYGNQTVLHQLDFDILEGSIFGIIGSSGCGKTTCLELMNGLLTPSEGSVFSDGQEVRNDLTDGVLLRRRMGYCIQGVGLFPHLTVLENISIIGKLEKHSRTDTVKRSRELCELVRLEYSKVSDKYPNELSGGQRQRVGLARALYMRPKIMLMDEPFAALDPLTRSEIQDLIMELSSQFGITVVLVTHDIIEAFKMCQEILLLHEGRIEQQGKPEQLLKKPKTDFVEKYLKVQLYTG